MLLYCLIIKERDCPSSPLVTAVIGNIPSPSSRDDITFSQLWTAVGHCSDRRSFQLSCVNLVVNAIDKTNKRIIFEPGSCMHPIKSFLSEGLECNVKLQPMLPMLLFSALAPLPRQEDEPSRAPAYFSPRSLFLNPPPPLVAMDPMSCDTHLDHIEKWYLAALLNYYHPKIDSQEPFCEETGLYRDCDSFNDLSDNFRSLLCRRCYRYGCAIHYTQQPFSFVRHDPATPGSATSRVKDHVSASSSHRPSSSTPENISFTFEVPLSRQIEQKKKEKSRNTLQKRLNSFLLEKEENDVSSELQLKSKYRRRYGLFRHLYNNCDKSGLEGEHDSAYKYAFSCSLPKTKPKYKANQVKKRKGVISKGSRSNVKSVGSKRSRVEEGSDMRLPEAALLQKIRQMVVARASGGMAELGALSALQNITSDNIDEISDYKSIPNRDLGRIASLLGTCAPSEVPDRLHSALLVLKDRSGDKGRGCEGFKVPLRDMHAEISKGGDTIPMSARKIELTSEFEPCHHTGPCNSASNCSCIRNNGLCEKFCSCSLSCENRVVGCRCKGGCRFQSCPCRCAGRSVFDDNESLTD